MKRLASLGFAVCALALATACGGGTISTPAVAPPASGQTSTAQGNVVFLLTVPTTSTSTAHRNIALPSGTQSVSVALQSVNGTTVSSPSPTVQNIGASATGCTAAGNQYVCQFTVSATAGSDVFLVKTYGQQNAGGSVMYSGNVAVNAASGQAVFAPAVLTGTVASIAITAPASLPVGVSGSAPLVIAAKDSSGNTIIGNYSNALTLSDTDASSQTSLSATNVPDSTTATTITLSYAGGAMTAPAVISATAPGVATASITAGKFSPSLTYPTVNGATYTYAINQTTTLQAVGQPTGAPTTNSMVETQSVATGATFNGVSNLVAVTASFSPAPPSVVNPAAFGSYFSAVGTDYYQWNTGTSSSSLQHVGSSGTVQSGSVPPATTTTTCAPPYYTAWIVPLSTPWDAYKGTGACTSTYNGSGSGAGFSFNETSNGDGSYAITAQFSGSYSESLLFTVHSDGTAVFSQDGTYGSAYIALQAPQSGSSTIPASVISAPGAFPSPMPSPASTTIPNWYATAGLPNGTVPLPLQQDVFTPKSTTQTLPQSCNTAIAPSGSTISEVDEVYTALDPLSGYVKTLTQWYLVNGIGLACGIQSSVHYNSGYIIRIPDTLYTAATTYSLTTSTLTAAMAKTRSFAQAYPAAQTGIFALSRHTAAMSHLTRILQKLQSSHQI